MVKKSLYEIAREENIKRNKELLASLGLDKPFFEPKETKPKKPTVPKKRKAPATDNADQPATKVLRVEGEPQSDAGSSIRRSARNSGKKVDYNSETSGSSPIPLSFKAGIRSSENTGPIGSQGGDKRIHDPKQYGGIPGVAVGTWWQTREGCSADAIHAPWVAGIAPGPKGAYSIALSGGYEDDVDLGYGFTYTGAGGRDLKGTKDKPKNLRTAPQSSDQSFDHNMNKSIKISAETKKPIRVIRGFKLKSKYGPSEGYRYDGLYTVEKAWIETGNNPGGFLVCKFAFKRLPGQPALPVRHDGATEEQPQETSETDSPESLETESQPTGSPAEAVVDTLPH